MPHATKVWRLLPHDPSAIERLAQALNLSPIVAQLLLNRNLSEAEPAKRFLTSPLAGLFEPELLPGVAEASNRLLEAVRQNKRICVYGDYDVDGVTGTAILLTALRLLGAVVEFYVPHRLEEGYGLNIQALRRLAQAGVAVVVTVDCGIASLEEAEEARRLGLELIVTDHHEPKETLPRADVLVHPRLNQKLQIADCRLQIDNATSSNLQTANGNRQSESTSSNLQSASCNLQSDAYPFGHLSGSGVAFKLAWALCKLASGGAKVTPQFREFLLDAVALAALGTVADVVPLNDENRILVRYGLNRLLRSPSQGLQALLQCAGLNNKPGLESMDIGYGIAPRLNAAGRLGTARLAVELLTTASPQRAGDLARFLEEQNQQRQTLERRIFHEARALAEERNGAPAIVLASSNWHPGLIGIVAGRLVELYHRPVLMIALRDNHAGQGSGRSIAGFKLHEALAECDGHLLSHGGHASAAGFRIDPGRVGPFQEHFCQVAAKRLGPEPSPMTLVLDAEVPLASLTPGLLASLKKLEPYGAGNPQPLFLAGGLQVIGTPKKVGGGERHLSFRVRQEGKEFHAIAFGQADRAEELMSASGHCCLVFTPRLNDYNGFRRVDLEIRDLQPGPHACLQ
jgi:single-stranded-DNA-specific exonuclease